MDDSAPPRILVLDDDPARVKAIRRRFPDAEVVWAETAAECIGLLDQHWDVIRLDHDLGGEAFVDSGRDDCGMEVARELEQNPRPQLSQTVMIVHTRNAAAGPAMVALLRRAGYNASYSPFRF